MRWKGNYVDCCFSVNKVKSLSVCERDTAMEKKERWEMIKQ